MSRVDNCDTGQTEQQHKGQFTVYCVLADVRNGTFEVGGTEQLCPCFSPTLSISTSFQSYLAAAKSLLTQANYSSLHLLQIGKIARRTP